MVFVYVSYTYDAWGNILSITGSLASTVGHINPFRYRGYYYDSETDFYYLNSRYYDAEDGTLVIIQPWFPSSFSFGFIGIKESQKNTTTLGHENGHILQMRDKGVIKYIFDVAIPSITINFLDRQGNLPYDYHSYPFEAEANELGGVTYSLDNPIPKGEYNYWSLVILLTGDILNDFGDDYSNGFGPIRPVY